MNTFRPIWRSMLFVPTHVEKFVASAHTRGADAYILDLWRKRRKHARG